MKIFFPKESEKETRSALDLASAKRLIDLGIEVLFESGVTQKIDIADQDLEDMVCYNHDGGSPSSQFQSLDCSYWKNYYAFEVDYVCEFDL